MPDTPQELQLTVTSLQQLENLAAQLATRLKPGDLVTLNGPLGAGKTTLVQKLGQALGLTEKMASPTFVLIHEYESGKIPVVHADLYRLGSEQAGSLAEELLDRLTEKRALILVEWATYGPYLTPYATLQIQIDIDPVTENRTLQIAAKSPHLLENLQNI